MALKKLTAQNKSLILSCLAGLGVIGTGWLSARAALKAERCTTKKEKILAYAPACICGAATLGCIGASTYISNEEIAALTVAGAATAQRFAEYRKAVHENASAEDEARINEAFYQSEIARLEQELAEREHPSEDDGTCEFVDSFSGYTFRAELEDVEAGIVEAMALYEGQEYLPWCDIFYLLNDKDTRPYRSHLGERFYGGYGWSKEMLTQLYDDDIKLEITLNSNALDEKPGVYVIEYTVAPEPCYMEY